MFSLAHWVAGSEWFTEGFAERAIPKPPSGVLLVLDALLGDNVATRTFVAAFVNGTVGARTFYFRKEGQISR